MDSIVFSDVTPADVKNALATARRTLGLLKVLTPFTPTALDDNAVEFLDKVLQAIEPHADDPAVAALVNLVLNLFMKKGKDGLVEALNKLS